MAFSPQPLCSMEVTVEHQQQLWRRRRQASWGQEDALASHPAAPTVPSAKHVLHQSSVARQIVVSAAAAVAAALVRWGWLGMAVLGMRLLFFAGLSSLLVDICVQLASTGRAATAGAVCVAAAQGAGFAPMQQLFAVQAVQQILTRLLCEGHVAAAAGVAGESCTCACPVLPSTLLRCGDSLQPCRRGLLERGRSRRLSAAQGSAPAGAAGSGGS